MRDRPNVIQWIYFLPDPFESYRSVFDQSNTQGLFDRAITAGGIDKFILVSVDMTTPLGCSWYVNSPVTGNWEDFLVQELVPYIDANFKLCPIETHAASPAITWVDMAQFDSV